MVSLSVQPSPSEPATLLARSFMVRDYVLRDRFGFDLDTASREARDDPAAFALAVVLDVPRRVLLFWRKPAPVYVVALAVLALR